MKVKGKGKVRDNPGAKTVFKEIRMEELQYH